jgi:hypothetical protein
MRSPNLDPHLIAVRSHAARLRLELDRADAAAAEYTGPGRERIITALLILREALDELDRRVDAEAAGQ